VEPELERLVVSLWSVCLGSKQDLLQVIDGRGPGHLDALGLLLLHAWDGGISHLNDEVEHLRRAARVGVVAAAVVAALGVHLVCF